MNSSKAVRWYCGDQKVGRAGLAPAPVQEFIIMPRHALQQIEADEAALMHFDIAGVRYEPRSETSELVLQEISL